jgi:hypothetical protein
MSAASQIYTLKTREGAYRSAAKSGLITTIAAGTASAGHVWAARWAPPITPGTTVPEKRRFAVLQRFRARWFTITGFTAAQEVALDLFRVTAYTAAHAGGSAITPSAKRTSFPAALMTGRVAAAVELTNGTETFDTDPIASGVFSELAAAATVPKGLVELYLSTEDLDRHPIILGPGSVASPGEGLVLRNSVLMGAAGTARLVVEMDWLEVERY